MQQAKGTFVKKTPVLHLYLLNNKANCIYMYIHVLCKSPPFYFNILKNISTHFKIHKMYEN